MCVLHDQLYDQGVRKHYLFVCLFIYLVFCVCVFMHMRMCVCLCVSDIWNQGHMWKQEKDTEFSNRLFFTLFPPDRVCHWPWTPMIFLSRDPTDTELQVLTKKTHLLCECESFFFSTCFSFLFNAHLWIDIIFSEVASPHESDLDDHTQVLLLGGIIQRNWRFWNRKPIFLLWRIWLICSHKGDNTGLKWATNQLFFPSTKNWGLMFFFLIWIGPVVAL